MIRSSISVVLASQSTKASTQIEGEVIRNVCGGRVLIGRKLYLAEKWTDDRDRCPKAGVPFAWAAGGTLRR